MELIFTRNAFEGLHLPIFTGLAEQKIVYCLPHNVWFSQLWVDLRTTGRWFDPRLGQYSFLGLLIVIVTGFIPLSPLSLVSTMVKWESSQWVGKNIVRSTG